MRIKKIELKNFKRFTDLTISDIPETSKLVLVIGSNGSGKSSLFDAFDWLSKGHFKVMPYSGDEGENYYRKNTLTESAARIELSDGNLIEKKGFLLTKGRELVNKFLGRSSIRIVPRISSNANPTNVSSDMDSPTTYIENDTRFINDVFLYIQQINNALREPVFSGRQADTLKIFRDFIEPLNHSLLSVFGGDEVTTIQIAEFQDATPNTTPKLIFKKGQSKINYDLLSHGEKQVIILLLNFIVRREYYKESILFIDEMDCHLNTVLQSNLLNEIVSRWIPDTAQLWTASHALGFIEYARNSNTASIIDFNLLNFDTKKELLPLSKDKLDVYEIAFPKSTIASILKGYKLVIVENKNDNYFNSALGPDGYLFLPANNNREVFLTIKSDKDKLGLRDRDYLRVDEIEKIKIQLPNLKILSLSTFENYIYHPDNIAELNFQEFNKDEYISEIIKQKKAALIEMVGEIGTSRNHYIEFKDCIKNDGNIKPITDSLQSDNFEEFYSYFNMKKHFNKKYLTQFTYSLSDLSKTNWFKREILKIIKS
jgi:AAA15 family ATPase/GTPase